jgi:hypothetical protein
LESPDQPETEPKEDSPLGRTESELEEDSPLERTRTESEGDPLSYSALLFEPRPERAGNFFNALFDFNENETEPETSKEMTGPSGSGNMDVDGHHDNKEVKLNYPKPFTGRREELKKFLQDCDLYLLINEKVYVNKTSTQGAASVSRIPMW